MGCRKKNVLVDLGKTTHAPSWVSESIRVGSEAKPSTFRRGVFSSSPHFPLTTWCGLSDLPALQ